MHPIQWILEGSNAYMRSIHVYVQKQMKLNFFFFSFSVQRMDRQCSSREHSPSSGSPPDTHERCGIPKGVPQAWSSQGPGTGKTIEYILQI